MSPTTPEPTPTPDAKDCTPTSSRLQAFLGWLKVLLPLLLALVGAVVAIVKPEWSPIVDEVKRTVSPIIVVPMEPTTVPDTCTPLDPEHHHELHPPYPFGDDDDSSWGAGPTRSAPTGSGAAPSRPFPVPRDSRPAWSPMEPLSGSERLWAQLTTPDPLPLLSTPDGELHIPT